MDGRRRRDREDPPEQNPAYSPTRLPLSNPLCVRIPETATSTSSRTQRISGAPEFGGTASEGSPVNRDSRRPFFGHHQGMQKLEAHEMPLHKVFSSDYDFQIPDYQRPS